MIARQWLGRTLGLALLAGALGACDFVKSTSVNPNAVSTASVDQLFVANQAAAFMFSENQVARMISIWMQQMAGTDRQFSLLDTYVLQETDADGEFSSVYTGGGLVDLRKAQAAAEVSGWKTYDGILKIYEGYLIGSAASDWGDIPYSQALDPSKPAALDKQENVYAAVQARLDTAIAELSAGGGLNPGGNDLVFGGSAARWTAAAHTLKARYYLHWAKAQKLGASAQAQVACGGDCIAKALAETALGIKDPSGDWSTVHTTAQTESNVWYQFMNDRSGYISGGAFLEDSVLQARNDPRLAIYYSPNSKGVYVGSQPGENLGDASGLSTGPNGFGLPDHRTNIVSCAENQFIAAETNYYLGNTAAAQSALVAGVACQDNAYGITAPVNATLTGSALLQEIITQKYIAQFLNPDVWEDWKRTCLPALHTFDNKSIPRRLLYGIGERQTNPNIPVPAQQPARNTNDPVGCLS